MHALLRPHPPQYDGHTVSGEERVASATLHEGAGEVAEPESMTGAFDSACACQAALLPPSNVARGAVPEEENPVLVGIEPCPSKVQEHRGLQNLPPNSSKREDESGGRPADTAPGVGGG